jgi:hypothetical protein
MNGELAHGPPHGYGIPKSMSFIEAERQCARNDSPGSAEHAITTSKKLPSLNPEALSPTGPLPSHRHANHRMKGTTQ